MFTKNKVLHYLLSSAAAASIAISLSSCSYRVSASEVPEPPAPVQTPVDAETAGLPADPAVENNDTKTAEEVDEEASPEILFRNALDKISSGAVEDGKKGLDGLRKAYPGNYWGLRASFLLGLDALERNSAEAPLLFEEAFALTDISEYAILYQAKAYRDLKKFPEAIASFDRLVSLYPDSVIRGDAIFLRAGTIMESGGLAEAKASFNHFITSYPKSSLLPEAYFNLARISAEMNELPEAASILKDLTVNYPAHALSKEAEAVFLSIKALSPEAPELTPEEHLKRAEGLFSSAKFGEAIAELSHIRENPEYRDRAVILTVRAQIRLKQYDFAEKTLKDYLKGPHPVKKELAALYYLAVTAAREGNEELLLECERKLSEKFPSTAERAEVLLFTANHYEAAKNHEKAIPYYKRILEKFKGTSTVEDALWSSGWIEYKEGRFEEAYRIFSRSADLGISSKNIAKFIYWSGRSAEKAGSAKDAVSSYEKVCGLPKSEYYCAMAEGRLGSINPVFHNVSSFAEETPVAEELPSEPLRPDPALLSDPHFLAAKELLILGLNGKASSEVDLLAKRHSGDKGSLYALAWLYYDAKDYYRAMRLYEGRLSGSALEFGAVATELTYPMRLIELIKKVSPKGAADPYLVAAVMREESSFNPRAVSITGAIGLMQIMPSTGRLIAKELGNTAFDSKELLDSETNIKLGAWYLGHLNRRFDNSLILTIAGYNAGPNAASRWAGVLPPELDEFIESIPYGETRNYAKRVLKSYIEYLRLAGINPSERFNRRSVHNIAKPKNEG